MSMLDASSLKRPKAMVFDWDNTLVDSWPTILDAQNHTMAAFGMPPWTIEEAKERVRKSMRDSFPAMFGAKWEEAGRIFYERFAENHLRTLTPLPGAAEMLHDLHAAGIYLAVVSNKLGDYLRKEARHLGWEGYFGRLVGALDATLDKPAREPVELALQGSEIPPGDRVWFAGDTDIDMECALNAGCLPVLVRHSPLRGGECDSFPPATHVVDCHALSILVRSL